MPESDISLIAHLVSRAGFGATRKELEAYASQGYESVVDDLINPERFPEVEEDLIQRYYDGSNENPIVAAGIWIYRMVNTERPLEEKMALFWHHIFATAHNKSNHITSTTVPSNMFRDIGMSDLGTILLRLSKDPAMLYFLDNNENHNGEPNENYGRELLELFSMGVGNYSEDDIKMAAKAFTGWTFTQPIPIYTQGRYPSEFVFIEEDHDNSEKTFLGETGNFNGEDIVDIIVKQAATARFISRHLYNFFVADEPQVPSWNETPPLDQKAIDALASTYMETNGDIRSMLEVLFNSDFFKEARFRHLKSPAELVAGVIKLVGTYRFPETDIMELSKSTSLMGQTLLDPPTVEGWHTGREWIDGGILTERVNFAVNEVGDVNKPGIKQFISEVSDGRDSLSQNELMDGCINLLGSISMDDHTKQALFRDAGWEGDLRFDTDANREASATQISRMLQLIVSTIDYQFA